MERTFSGPTKIVAKKGWVFHYVKTRDKGKKNTKEIVMTAITREANPLIGQQIQATKGNFIQQGQTFPNVTLTRYNPSQRENFTTHNELTLRRAVIFTVPGAWTPTCTDKHLFGFTKAIPDLKKRKIEHIICIAPDKVDVVKAWGELKGAPEIQMWADNELELTLKMGLGLDMSGNRAQGMGMQRTAMVVNNLVVEWIEVDSDPKNVEKSSAEAILNYLDKA